MIGPAPGRRSEPYRSRIRRPYPPVPVLRLIVDPPADIVVECTTALAPPCVRSLDVSGEITHHIHKLQFSQPFVDICALLGEEPGMRFVALAFLMSSGVCAMLKSPQSTACFPPCAASSRNCSMRISMVSRKRYFCFIFSGSSVFPACTYTQTTVMT